MVDKSIIHVGSVEVMSVSDGTLSFDKGQFFPDISEESWRPYMDELTPDGRVLMNVGSFVLRSEGKTILVDTGLGPDPLSAGISDYGHLLDDIMAKEVPPNEVDIVLMTHIHVDHVGWNLTAGKPTFPMANYLIPQREWDYWTKPEVVKDAEHIRNQVLPLKDHNVIEFMGDDYQITDELTTVSTPGHTPGHVSIAIASQGERAYILGDVAHSPAQAHYTDWCPIFDVEPDLSRKTRHQVLDMLEAQGILVSAGHFPDPGFGHFVKGETRRMWQGI